MVLSKQQLIDREEYFDPNDSGCMTVIYQKCPVTDSPDLAAALQPNGIDISLDSVEMFLGEFEISADGKSLPRMMTVHPDTDGYFHLVKGSAYLVRFNETVNLPNDVMAYLRPRSTLLRSGVAMHTAVWDAGYCGKGQSLVTAHASGKIQRNARIGQLVFHRLEMDVEEGYSGSYQGEGITPEFRQTVDEFIDEYRPALENIANG